jgi:hypothetical protein
MDFNYTVKEYNPEKHIYTLKDGAGCEWKFCFTPSSSSFISYPKHFNSLMDSNTLSSRSKRMILFTKAEKAIKHWELISGLEGDARDTWEDILT